MGKASYIGVSSKAHKIKKGYIGVGGKARKIKKAYIGVGGKARLWWTSGVQQFVGFRDTGSSISKTLMIIDGNTSGVSTKTTTGLFNNTNGLQQELFYANDKWWYFAFNTTNIGTAPWLYYTADLNTWTSFRPSTLPFEWSSKGYFLGVASDDNYIYILVRSGDSTSQGYYAVYLASINVKTLDVTYQNLESLISSSSQSALDLSDYDSLVIRYDGYLEIRPFKLNQVSPDVWVYDRQTKTIISRIDSKCRPFRRAFSSTEQCALNNGFTNKLGKYKNGVFTESSYQGQFFKNGNTAVYGNGIYVTVLKSSSAIGYSSDLVTWTPTTLTDLPSDYSYRTLLAYGGGKFWFLGFRQVASQSNVWSSIDGETWTLKVGATGSPYGDFCYSNTYGFGDN